MTVSHTRVITRYLTHLTAAGRRPSTVEQRRWWAHRIVRDLPGWRHATTGDLEQWLAGSTWSPETRKAARASLRSFYGWAHREQLLVEHDPAAQLLPVAVPDAQPRPVPEQLLRQALTRADERDVVAVLLAGRMGLRRGEIAAATAEHVVDGWLVVHGKGGRQRMVPLHPQLVPLLPARGPLVPSHHGGGHLSAAHVGKILSLLLGPGTTGHQLRHRFAATVHAELGDVRHVQALLGHASLSTTQRYTPVRPDVLVRGVHAA
jgi:integrase